MIWLLKRLSVFGYTEYPHCDAILSLTRLKNIEQSKQIMTNQTAALLLRANAESLI